MINSQRYTREIPRRYRLEAVKFRNSGNVSFARRLVDPETGDREYDTITMKGTGKILSYTIIHITADDYGKLTPFPVAIIETDEGARLTAMVTDTTPEELKIGAKVELIFRKIGENGHTGIINYGYKAVITG